MTHKNKIKGLNFERKIVKKAKNFGLDAHRVPLSGAVLQYPEDIVIEGKLYQCKKKHKLPQWLHYSNTEGVIIAEDYGKEYILIKLETYFNILKQLHNEI